MVAYSLNSKFKVKNCKFQYRTLLGEFQYPIKRLDVNRNEKNRLCCSMFNSVSFLEHSPIIYTMK